MSTLTVMLQDKGESTLTAILQEDRPKCGDLAGDEGFEIGLNKWTSLWDLDTRVQDKYDQGRLERT